jgi:hypothetical protein
VKVHQQIKELESQGRLFRYVPKSRHRSRRRLFLAKAALLKLNDQTAAINAKGGQGKIKAAFDKWTLDELIQDKFLEPLKPPPADVWEIRIVDPAPQLRVIGLFAAPDTFVVMDIHTRDNLDRFGSQAWRSAMKNAAYTWERLFGNSKPFRGESKTDYVTDGLIEL